MTPLQTVESMYDAFRRGDIAHIVSQLAADVFWRQPTSVPWGGDFHGQAGAERFFARLNEVVETTAFDVEENIEAKDQVFTYGFYSCRDRSTGKESRSRFVFRWQFANGKVTRYEAVIDSAPVAEAARA